MRERERDEGRKRERDEEREREREMKGAREDLRKLHDIHVHVVQCLTSFCLRCSYGLPR